MTNHSSELRARLSNLYDRTHDADQLLELLRASLDGETIELENGVLIDPTRPVTIVIEMLEAMREEIESLQTDLEPRETTTIPAAKRAPAKKAA